MKADSLLAQTKRMLCRFELKARKKLGQHFLIDDGVLRFIIDSGELTSGDTVIEVGSGLGILTRELAEKAGSVLAVELDDNLAVMLKESLDSFENVTVINRDILQIEPYILLPESMKYKVVANLPYYITARVLRYFLEAEVKPELMIVMVQKEVAEVVAAESGQRSLLSISVQFYGKPEIISYVPAQAFYPVPEVDSAVLRIEVYPEPMVAVKDADSFFKLVRAGFTASRKQLVNSLAQGMGLPKTDVLTLLEQAGIMLQRRAETLTLEEWARLWQVFNGRGESK